MKDAAEDGEDAVIAVIRDVHGEGKRLQRGCLATFLVWLAGLGAAIWLGKLPLAEREKWEWLASVIWVTILILVPAVGILLGIELKGYLDWKEKKTAGTAGFRLLIILGCWLSAAVAGFVGLLGLLGAIEHADSWGLWKVIPGAVLCLAIMALALFLLVLPFRRRSGMNEVEQRMAHERYLERLAHPDFEGIEKEAGAKLPELYKSLFGPESEWLERQWAIYPGGLDNDETIHDFEALVPAHLDALREHSSGTGRFLAFAEGDCAEYWIQLGVQDPPVYSHSTEDYESEDAFQKICGKLSIFLSWPKEEI